VRLPRWLSGKPVLRCSGICLAERVGRTSQGEVEGAVVSFVANRTEFKGSVGGKRLGLHHSEHSPATGAEDAGG
jgi:hypothetical protein